MNRRHAVASALALLLPVAASAQKKGYPDTFAVLNELNKASTVMVVANKSDGGSPAKSA